PPVAAPAVRNSRRREAAILASTPQPEATTTGVAASEEASPTEAATARRTTPRPVAATEARPSSRPQTEARRNKDEKLEAPAALYTIRPGDNLTKLAREQGVSIAQLKAWNKLTTEQVVAGQQLRLSAPAVPIAAALAATPRRARPEATGPQLETHTVQPGDTLFSIARHFGLSLEELKRLNHLASDQVKLKPGQKLVVHG
ncbi:MAG: LysM peptidoglycan-binding domain-containing protein, partial [Cytophagaceae bacterium]